MTHPKHAGQMFVVMRCHFYTVTFLKAATFSGYFACLRSGCAESGGWGGKLRLEGSRAKLLKAPGELGAHALILISAQL